MLMYPLIVVVKHVCRTCMLLMYLLIIMVGQVFKARGANAYLDYCRQKRF